jgi:hypothetical protein
MKMCISIVLLATIISQSCAVYHKTPVSLSQTIDQGKVRVIKKDGTQQTYKSIELMFIKVRNLIILKT